MVSLNKLNKFLSEWRQDQSNLHMIKIRISRERHKISGNRKRRDALFWDHVSLRPKPGRRFFHHSGTLKSSSLVLRPVCVLAWQFILRWCFFTTKIRSTIFSSQWHFERQRALTMKHFYCLKPKNSWNRLMTSFAVSSHLL